MPAATGDNLAFAVVRQSNAMRQISTKAGAIHSEAAGVAERAHLDVSESACCDEALFASIRLRRLFSIELVSRA